MSEPVFLETSPSTGVSEDERSDKSLCLDALVMEEEHDSHLANNASRDNSDVTEPVSNTTATCNSTATPKASLSQRSATELTSLLEQATALSERQRKKRSNSFDSKRTSPSCFTGAGDVMGKVLYKSAPCLDFFDPYDQDPYLEEEASRKGSWWGDSEHRASYRDLQKDFSKSVKIFTASSVSTKGTDKSAVSNQSSTSPPQETGDESAPGQEFWLEDTEHSLLQKIASQKTADVSVTSGATEMAVAPNLFSSKLLASRSAGNSDAETETVTTCPVTPSTVSKETVGSSLASSAQTNLQKVFMTPKVDSKSPKTPRTPKSTISMTGGKAKTPQTAGKKKMKVIKVRAAKDSEEVIDAVKVQEALKKWKMEHAEGAAQTSSASEADARRIPAALSPKKRALSKRPGPVRCRASSSDEIAPASRPKNSSSAERNRSRSSSCGRPAQDQEIDATTSPQPRPRSLSRPRPAERAMGSQNSSTFTISHPPVEEKVTPEASPATPQPAKVHKNVIRRSMTSEDDSPTKLAVKSSEERVRSKSLTRGKVRSNSVGRREKLPDMDSTVRSTARSTILPSSANDASKRVRSRSLGKLGSSLFRRKGPDPPAPSPPGGDHKGFFSSVMSLTHAVSRTPRSSAARSYDDLTAAPRSKSLTRMRVDPPPLTPSESAPTLLHDASTRALCGPATFTPHQTPRTPIASRRSRRPVPSRSPDLPKAIDVSPSHVTSLPSKSSSVEANSNDNSIRQRMHLLDNSFSEVSDDGLFQRIQSAGVTEEMMHRLRELGLIITEAPRVAAAHPPPPPTPRAR